MGKRGRKPLGKAELDRHKSRWAAYAHDHPEGPPLSDSAPSWLGKFGKAEWQRIVASAEATGVVTSWDYAMLVGYCEAWNEFVLTVHQIKDDLERPGTQSGIHPLLKVKDSAWKRVSACAKELGFTPASRARIDIVNHENEQDEPDSQAKFFKLG